MEFKDEKNIKYSVDAPIPMSWDEYFIRIARTVSLKSKDPSTKVGAVITRNNQPVSFGFNGFPRGIEDTQERLEDRETKHTLVLHAEENAILYAREDLQGCTMYTWPFMTCPSCSLKIIQVGIKRVVCPTNERNLQYQQAIKNYDEAGVLINFINPRYFTQVEETYG